VALLTTAGVVGVVGVTAAVLMNADGWTDRVLVLAPLAGDADAKAG
jgi:hypothetical protein